VLRGAEKTLLRFRPIVICEHKGHERAYQESPSTIDYLRTLGAVVLEATKKDVILGWR